MSASAGPSPSPGTTPLVSSLRTSKALIEPVLAHPSRIRNVCILAHVDHGKTTLTDTLLASNGIISFKQAGKLRYLDSREDEQSRGITMEASAITLLFDAPVAPGQVELHAINLIDSPGHVDFSRQVVTATRLCDGCLVLVDAVEGVCTQTMAVLRQAKRERLTPCLVINKIDRLVTELRMSSTDAASQLNRLLEQVNAIQATIRYTDDDADPLNGSDPVDRPAAFSHLSSGQHSPPLNRGDGGAEAEKEAAPCADHQGQPDTPAFPTFPNTPTNTNAEQEEEDQTAVTFHPLMGNVIFASSTDGWAFTIEQFVKLYSRKLEMNPSILKKTLWGDFYYEGRSKKILQKRAAEKLDLKKTMFAQFVLDAIWAVYECSVVAWDQAKIEKIAAQTGARLSTREIRAKEGRAVLKTLMGQWLPLAETIFGAIVAQIPDPVAANGMRLASIVRNVEKLPEASQSIVRTLVAPKHPAAEPAVLFISKLFSVTMQQTSITSQRPTTPSSDDSISELSQAMFNLDANEELQTEKLIGMARLFHGTLALGQTVHILGPKHVPGKHVQTTEFLIQELFLLMGRDLEPVNKVHMGSVFGIGGIAPYIGKSATLSSTPECPILEPPRGEIAPIVRVAVRPAQLEHLSDVVAGLQLLAQADPCAETYLQEENGEHILATAGELHLEQCLKDLQERYTKKETELIISPPMVPYRETIAMERACNEESWKVNIGFNDSVRSEDGMITLSSVDGNCRIGARAVAIPELLLEFMLANRTVMREAVAGKLGAPELHSLLEKMQKIMKNCAPPWPRFSPSMIWAFAPRREGTNMLLCSLQAAPETKGKTTTAFYLPGEQLRPYQSSILTAFQLATEKGPLAHEPMMGVAFVVETFELAGLPEDDQARCQLETVISSQLISLGRTLFETAFLYWSPRLMLAVYRCTVQTTAEMLGKVYSTLSKRRGRVISEEYHEGTGFFTINSRLPVAESFGFSDDLRGRTAGVAIPQLVFAGFETLPQDPYWVPATEEELGEHGRFAEGPENIAMRYLIGIRERKGLFVERKIVQFAEKQRTLRR